MIKNFRYFSIYTICFFCVLQLSAQKISVEHVKDYYNQGDFTHTITLGDSLLKNQLENFSKFEIALTMSSAYGQLGVYDRSYEYAELAAKSATALNDTSRIIMASINKVGCFFFLKNYKAGISLLNNLKKYIDSDAFIKNKKDVYDAYSMFYDYLNKRDSSIYFVNKQITLNKKFPDAQYGKALASYCDIINDVEKCNAEIDTFYKFYPKLELTQTNLLSLYKMLFKYYINTKQVEKADLYKDSLQQIGITNAGDYHQKTYYQFLHNYYLLYNDTINAYNALVKFRNYNAKIDSANSSSNVLKAEQILQIEKIKLKATTLESSLKESQQKLTNLVIAIALVLSLLSVILVLYRNQYKQSKALEKTANDRVKMISILSHDIRSPLAQLISLIELSDSSDLTQEEQHKYLKRIKNKTQETLNMLDNVVHWILSQNQNSHVHFKPIDLNNLFKAIKSENSLALESKQISLESNFSFSNIQSDFNFLKTALQNLVTNAIKFSNQNSKVLIASGTYNGKPALWVQDFGAGMSLEQLKKLQDGIAFTSKSKTNHKGLGLGMEIVRSSIKRIGATLHIESNLNEGSTFYILFND